MLSAGIAEQLDPFPSIGFKRVKLDMIIYLIPKGGKPRSHIKFHSTLKQQSPTFGTQIFFRIGGRGYYLFISGQVIRIWS